MYVFEYAEIKFSATIEHVGTLHEGIFSAWVCITN